MRDASGRYRTGQRIGRFWDKVEANPKVVAVLLASVVALGLLIWCLWDEIVLGFRTDRPPFDQSKVLQVPPEGKVRSERTVWISFGQGSRPHLAYVFPNPCSGAKKSGLIIRGSDLPAESAEHMCVSRWGIVRPEMITRTLWGAPIRAREVGLLIPFRWRILHFGFPFYRVPRSAFFLACGDLNMPSKK